MFLEKHISILEWFLKEHVTLKTTVMAAESSAQILFLYKKYNKKIKNKKLKSQYYFLLHFWSNKCSFAVWIYTSV